MRFSAPVAVVVALAVAVVPVAHAAVKRKEDRRAGVVFRLSGTHLTMKLRDQGNPRTVKKVVGQRLAAACGTNASRGGTIVDATFTWPKGRSSVAVDFDRDISRRVAYCVLERNATDIAVVRFPR
jgi:hypothetical protein